ncbi:MAG: TetR/AcrR family transcriptional regulator [Panacagrimonas sp.]
MTSLPAHPTRLPRPPGRGRPKDPDKRAAILAAAKKLITARGLAGTSMEDIAAEAGVSKLTVYSHFQNKEELFQQTIFSKCNDHWPEVLFDTLARQPLRSRLSMIGLGFLELVNSEEVLSLYRLLAADGNAPGKFGRLFWEAGPERTMQRFAQVLEVASRAGELSVPDPRQAAAHFFVLLKGEYHIKSLVGAAPPLEAAKRQAHVEEVLDLFLRAYAPAGSSSKPSNGRIR